MSGPREANPRNMYALSLQRCAFVHFITRKKYSIIHTNHNIWSLHDRHDRQQQIHIIPSHSQDSGSSNLSAYFFWSIMAQVQFICLKMWRLGEFLCVGWLRNGLQRLEKRVPAEGMCFLPPSRIILELFVHHELQAAIPLFQYIVYKLLAYLVYSYQRIIKYAQSNPLKMISYEKLRMVDSFVHGGHENLACSVESLTGSSTPCLWLFHTPC
ncbi:hypothetical protein OCU04_005967 [Sclerotinia nivalis]|uniref:Uncharacterized protein n=1 Tax=Sclerotinia nivalis TaxID=352851 RepID=A0A9X0DLN0_9HELO|nr:hypothetical protein OCU04_005967 [Sclerotinia nivalis]